MERRFRGNVARRAPGAGASPGCVPVVRGPRFRGELMPKVEARGVAMGCRKFPCTSRLGWGDHGQVAECMGMRELSPAQECDPLREVRAVGFNLLRIRIDFVDWILTHQESLIPRVRQRNWRSHFNSSP